MTNFWLGKLSDKQVEQSVRLGTVQVGFTSKPELERMNPGDWLFYYSTTRRRGQKGLLDRFTAFGIVSGDGIMHATDLNGAYYHRDVDYLQVEPVDLADVRASLGFTQEQRWDSRPGLRALSRYDATVIAEALTGSDPERFFFYAY